MKMLKKIFVPFALSLFIALPLYACSNTQNSADSSQSLAETSAAQTDSSATNNTGSIAESSATSTNETGSENPAPTGEAEDGTYDFTLGFIGDICLADNYLPMQYLASIGSTNISDGIDQRFIDLMRSEDIMWANNEFVYSNQGEALEGKAWTFKSKPENVDYLHDLGVDIVGLANNHTFDYGQYAFLDTLNTLDDAGIPYTGAGRNAKEARGPVYQEIDGFTIAYVNASSAEYTIYTPEATDIEPGIAWCYDTTKFLEDIRTADANADFVVALPHWGTEHSTWLTDEQLNGARSFIDAGADAVIGAHTHILQGLEYYNGKPIFYSLGNFWFDDYTIDTCVAELHISGEVPEGDPRALDNANVELTIYPGTQSGVFTSWAETPEERDRILRYLESISIDITIDEEGIVHPASSSN